MFLIDILHFRSPDRLYQVPERRDFADHFSAERLLGDVAHRRSRHLPLDERQSLQAHLSQAASRRLCSKTGLILKLKGFSHGISIRRIFKFITKF